jgi:hypothetical protein
MELRVRNRKLIESDLSTIRSLIQTEGFLGRSHLSRRLCRLWQWRQSNGAYREIACRDVLRQLERRGLIELPPALHAARRAGYQNQVQAPSVVMDPIELSLDRMRAALRIEVVESRAQRQLLRDLLAAYHYLGYQQPTGACLGYLVFWQDRPVACARFGPAAWNVAVRDQFPGWTPEQRRRGLRHLVNNDRWLIVPWVRVAHLASFLLGKIVQRLAQDWRSVYRESIVLAETFVDAQRFGGICYRAANWLCLGQSRGRGRNDRNHSVGEPFKSIWVYPLKGDFQRQLQEAAE